MFTLRRCGVLATRIVCPPCVAEAEAKAAAWEQGQKEAKAKREAAREAKAERERAWKEHRAALAAERERKQAEKVAARKAAEAERQEKREAREAEKRKRREARELLEEIQASHADRALLLLEIRDLRRQVEVMLAEWRGEFPEAPPATPAREWGRGGVGWDYPA